MRKFLILLAVFLFFTQNFLSAAGTGEKGAKVDPKDKYVSVMAYWGGDEEAGFREVLKAFTAKTGIPYIYEGNRDMGTLLNLRIASGDPPDIAMTSSPGTMARYAKEGVIKALDGSDPILPKDILNKNYSQAWIDLGTVDGKFYGLTVKCNSKSTFWYKPASFKALGVSPPDTFAGLLEIADKYLAAGKTPYSIGGGSTWTLTDWFENIYVRVAGPEKYLKLFVTHEVKWTDPSVVKAFGYFKEIVYPENKLAGGVEGTLSTGFIDGFDVILRKNPGAEMYFEGGFMSSFAEQNFPKLVGGKDYSFFAFPEIDPKWGKPVVGGGDLAIVFEDRPNVRELIRFLASKEANTIWATAKKGAVVSPNKNVPLNVYPVLKGLEAAQVTQAESFVFDGSDLSPSAIGGDAMRIALQNFITDPGKLNGILKTLEAAAERAYK